MSKNSYYHFYYYVPKSQLEQTKNAIFKAGAGLINNYSCCAWETKGTGQFYPEKNSKPFLGRPGKMARVVEYKVETICHKKYLAKVIRALKQVHPYEEPALGAVAIQTLAAPSLRSHQSSNKKAAKKIKR